MQGSRLSPPRRRTPPEFGLAQVNIVLLLVLFFLVVGTIVETDEMVVQLPETQELPLDRLPRPLLLLRDDGSWVLDGDEVGVPGLLAALEPLEPDTALNILAGRDLPADLLLETVDLLAPSGRPLRLVTLKSGVEVVE
ncbi:biopolymer transporter ExbD [Roseicyclus sp. F158]|uniref:Biopolymer transporter ExbD n=1 Tax=Tropicimonas omnivorans TaxID=3075590 RepID=A0ABU3DE11_9RHOB|nr:biopolymer transporter ExbD [Roseicyclus sp. F158]MDT0681955.1 biopolymer transporter ExbD [Roseicyclus sp. F158]